MKNKTFPIISIIPFLLLFMRPGDAQSQQVFNLDNSVAKSLTAAVYLQEYGSAAFFNHDKGFFYSTLEQEDFQPEWFEMDGFKVDGAVRWSDDMALLFSGQDYVIFTISTAEIGTELYTFPGLPAAWNGQLDAAFDWGDGLFFFTKGDKYVVYDGQSEQFTNDGNLSKWEGWPADWTNGVDAAMNLEDGNIYFFHKGKVLVYNQEAEQFSSPEAIGAVETRKSETERMGHMRMPPPVGKRMERQQDADDETKKAVAKGDPSSVQVSPEDEYRDDYTDHADELMDDASDWTAQPLPGLDWLGAGFDILRYDPMEPNNLKNRKKFRTVIMTNSLQRAGNHSQYLKPYGCFFGSENAGKVADSSSWVTTYEQFRNSFSVGAGGSVSVPGLASSSLSGSHSEMNSTAVGSESIYMFNKIIRRLHQADIELTWTDLDTGQKYKQKIDPVFKNDVAALPLPKTSADALSNIHITEKGQRLPVELYPVKTKYDLFMNKFGTHYASSVNWGGKYIARTQVKRADYEKSRSTQTAFMSEAEAQISMVTVGRSVNFQMGDGQTNSTSKSVFRREVFVQGGNGEDDQDKWRDKVDLNPAPVELGFTSICDLLIKELFPKDADINLKREALRLITEFYIVNTYREPKHGGGDFFRPLPDLPMPGNISITNGGGYVMWFKVKYEYQGKWVEKATESYTLGNSKSIEVPVDATNITVTASHTFADIFTKTFSKPETVCFKCWGTVFDATYGKCDN